MYDMPSSAAWAQHAWSRSRSTPPRTRRGLVQGIVTCIGFIGAGAILHSGRHTEGVTTAASIWACTMVGVAAGAVVDKIMVAATVLAISS